jgi:hypothetical protein
MNLHEWRGNCPKGGAEVEWFAPEDEEKFGS